MNVIFVMRESLNFAQSFRAGFELTPGTCKITKRTLDREVDERTIQPPGIIEQFDQRPVALDVEVLGDAVACVDKVFREPVFAAQVLLDAIHPEVDEVGVESVLMASVTRDAPAVHCRKIADLHAVTAQWVGIG